MAHEKRTHIYCRVSSAVQEEGSSLDTQEAACRSYAAAHGLTVMSVAREVWSGADRHRPKLDALLDRLTPGDVVLVYALDRFSRSQVDTAILIDRLEASGASLRLVTEDFERSATGTFLRNAKAFVAELEREKIKERTGRGKHARVASGKPLAGLKAPFGYQWVDPEKKKGGKTRMELDPDTAPIVRMMFDWALAGGSLRRIAARLTEMGIPTATGNPRWSPAGVRLVLRRTTYTGTHTVYQTRKERQPNGKYTERPATAEEQVALTGIAPAIISPEEHAAVLTQLDYNKAHATRHNIYPEATLLRAGYIRCGHCGYVMGVRNAPPARPTHSPIYICPSPTCKQPGVTQPTIAASIIDPIVWGLVRAVLSDPAIIARELDKQRNDGALDRDLAALDTRLAANATKQTTLARRIAVLSDDAAEPVMTELELLAAAKRTMEADRAELVRRLADADTDRARVRTLTEWMDTVSANLETLTYDERRTALAALGVRVLTHRPGATDETGAALDRWEVTMQPLGSEGTIALGSTRDPAPPRKRKRPAVATQPLCTPDRRTAPRFRPAA
jgi:site-specific DNA recombinase